MRMSLLDLLTKLLQDLSEHLNPKGMFLQFPRPKGVIDLDSYLSRDSARNLEGSALPWTARHGKEGIAHKSLSAHANKQTMTVSLLKAAGCNHTQMAEPLLGKGADRDVQDGKCGGTVYRSLIKGHDSATYRQIIEDAHDNATAAVYENSLQAASQVGHKTLRKMLIDMGADVKAEGGDHGNALHVNAPARYKELEKRLLNKGADIFMQDISL